MLSEYTVNRIYRPYEHIPARSQEVSEIKFLPDQAEIEQMKIKLRQEREGDYEPPTCIHDTIKLAEARRKDIEAIARFFKRNPWMSVNEVSVELDQPIDDVWHGLNKALTPFEQKVLPFIYSPLWTRKVTAGAAATELKVSRKRLITTAKKWGVLYSSGRFHYVRMPEAADANPN